MSNRPLLFLAPLALLTPHLVAADNEGATPRLCAQLLVGTAGLEPGVAAEWTLGGGRSWKVRPELFLSRHADPGVGVSVSWEVAPGELPNGQELFIGPRVAYHNDHHDGNNGNGNGNGNGDDHDHIGWEASALGMYLFPIAPGQGEHHYIEAMGALGVMEKHDDARFGASFGAAYQYRF